VVRILIIKVLAGRSSSISLWGTGRESLGQLSDGSVNHEDPIHHEDCSESSIGVSPRVAKSAGLS